MGAIINRATTEYRTAHDMSVRAELEAAGIPVLTLPTYLNSEVKTCYVGLLNGFVFYRAWRYWVCEGDMPLHHAKEIYNKYRTLMVRADGHAGNLEPAGYDPSIQDRVNTLIARMQQEGATIEEMSAAADRLDREATENRYVKCYHIDTTEGLAALVAYIKANGIYACNGKVGSYRESVAPAEEMR